MGTPVPRRDIEERAGITQPCKVSIDISNFKEYGESAAIRLTKKMPLLSVRRNGRIRLSREIGDTISDGEEIKIYINNPATIAVIKVVAKGGLAVKANTNKGSECGRVMEANCRRLVKDLLAKGLAFPVRWEMKWNPEKEWWEGRLIK